jgi:hypothetical protein
MLAEGRVGFQAYSKWPMSRGFFNPILHTAWLNIHALTLKRNTAKYYFGEKSSFLHTFLKFCCEYQENLSQTERLFNFNVISVL